MNKKHILLSLVCLVSASAYAVCPICPGTASACQESTTVPAVVIEEEQKAIEVEVAKSAAPEATAPATTSDEEVTAATATVKAAE